MVSYDMISSMQTTSASVQNQAMKNGIKCKITYAIALLCICLLLTACPLVRGAGDAVEATGEGVGHAVDATGEGIGHAVEGTGDAIGSAGRELAD